MGDQQVDPRAFQLPQGRRHVPALDGLRGIAVLMVMVFHYVGLLRWPHSGWRDVVRLMALPGQLGVELFFILSGFLITGILLEAKGSPHYFRNFYARRSLRILPVYYGYLLVALVFIPLFIHQQVAPARQLLCWFLFLHNFAFTFGWPIAAGPTHFWSLAVEEHFYLIWPIIVLLLPTRRLLWALAAIALSAIACRAILPLLGYGVFYFSFARLDTLAAGSALAVWMRNNGPDPIRTWAAWSIAPLAVIVFLMFCLFSGSGAYSVEIVKFSIVGLLFTAVLAVSVTTSDSSIVGWCLGHRWLRLVGKYSYAMYVLHPAIFFFIISRWDGGGTDAQPVSIKNAILLLPVAFLGTTLAAFSSWHAFEKHFLRLKRFFEYAHPPLPDADPGMVLPSISGV